MTTKTQLVDFIYSNFIFIHGVQVTKSGLQKKSKEELEKIIQSTGTKNISLHKRSNFLLTVYRTVRNIPGTALQIQKSWPVSHWKKKGLK